MNLRILAAGRTLTMQTQPLTFAVDGATVSREVWQSAKYVCEQAGLRRETMTETELWRQVDKS